jgi:hypothetical protein
MAAPYNPPVKGEDFVLRIGLQSLTARGRFQVTPTISPGDFQIDKDGGGFVNLAALPTVDPAGSKAVKVVLSAAEMTADVVTLLASDQSEPPEWADFMLSIPTVAS